jgi:1,2-diacylglycerol 3-alpha-glucosyltransferase
MTASSRPLHLLLMWVNFGPYHLARLTVTQRHGENLGCRVLGLELAGAQQIYQWEGGNARIDKVTLFPDQAFEEVSSYGYVFRIWQVLSETQPDVLALPGYDQPAILSALAWAKINGKLAIFMSDSKADDQPRQGWKECLKRLLVRRFDAALVGGKAHKKYAISLGIPAKRVFVGYDVVDNRHFARGAAAARAREETLRRELRLPFPYFLTVCRFIEKKNLVRLLDAYRIYRNSYPQNPWELVLCGSGPLEDTLKKIAADLPGVHFPGFKQADELPAFYGLAGAFILPSSHFEQWGLVVNEAMAAGLPVLVSQACGCAPDLVNEGVNGFTFDPYDIEEMARLMMTMSSGLVDLKAMRQASRQIIAEWPLEAFAQNLFKAVEATQVGRMVRLR